MQKGPHGVTPCGPLSNESLQVYFGQPSAFTSLSGKGLMFFTAGGMRLAVSRYQVDFHATVLVGFGHLRSLCAP